MCYNASVHYWHVTRVLQRPGVRAPLLPSMEAVVKAVDGVPGQEEWKVQLRTSLALTYAEAGRPATAPATRAARWSRPDASATRARENHP